MSYIEKAQQNKVNAQKAKRFDTMEQQAMLQRTIEAHIAHQKELEAQKHAEETAYLSGVLTEQDHRIQLLADEQAAAQGLKPSTSPHATAARSWKPPAQQPSLLDDLTSYLGRVADGASNLWGKAEDRWDKYRAVDTYRGEPKAPIDPHAELRSALAEEQQAFEASQFADKAIRQAAEPTAEARYQQDKLRKQLKEKGDN